LNYTVTMNQPDNLEFVPVENLIPYARNSRTHSDAQVAQIAASIKEFGFTNPVLIDEADGIIAGHGRLLAARKLGMAEVPCLRLGYLSEIQKRAYIIADNKLALNSGWDDELLKLELGELDAKGFDLELTGFIGDDLTEAMFGPLLDDVEDAEQRQIDAEKYTTKIEVPIYEMKGEKPPVLELYNEVKTADLISRINNANLPDEVRSFLLAAACRHTIFNYEKIAEFYAHQDDKVQQLMEDSALVIVDYQQAIENGFVKLTKALIELSAESDLGNV
jgi:ParB-like chromosome segregation protein Spo0J